MPEPNNCQQIINCLIIGLLICMYLKCSRREHFSNLSALPIGSIIAYNTTLSTSIPTNFALCDGSGHKYVDEFKVTRTIPDLRGRFILGAGTAGMQYNLTQRNPGHIGGDETNTLTEAEMPRHAHAQQGAKGSDKNLWIEAGESYWYHPYDGVYTWETGGSQAHNNMPPFYTLVYIIKVA